MQPTMEEAFQAACKARAIPGVVLMAFDKTGKFSYNKSFGLRTLQDLSQTEPLTIDSTMWIASCTKLLTSISAMQCVERGLVSLDEDIRPILHEFGDVDILTGVDETTGEIRRHKNTTPITLRQLLTHTSGLTYEEQNPLLQQWRKQQPGSQGALPNSIHGRFLHPLIFEPGTSWSYGPGLDWVGVLIERLTHSKTLQDYMHQHIWSPLGITDMTFFLSTRPDLRGRMMPMSGRSGSARSNDGPAALSPVVYNAEQPGLGPDREDAQGGEGITTSAAEYIKVLRALLLASDASGPDGALVTPAQLLHRSTVDAMFAPQLGEASRARLQALCAIPQVNDVLGGLPIEARRDHGLGGMLVLDDLEGSMRKGTLTWGGKPNLCWWVDREAGLCGLYATQMTPLGDKKTLEMQHLFQKTMYARHSAVAES